MSYLFVILAFVMCMHILLDLANIKLRFGWILEIESFSF